VGKEPILVPAQDTQPRAHATAWRYTPRSTADVPIIIRYETGFCTPTVKIELYSTVTKNWAMIRSGTIGAPVRVPPEPRSWPRSIHWHSSRTVASIHSSTQNTAWREPLAGATLGLPRRYARIRQRNRILLTGIRPGSGLHMAA
jgi:hypothetical protein